VGHVDFLKKKKPSWEVQVGSCYGTELSASIHRQVVGSVPYSDDFIACLMVSQI
jgi:hypothetical protein